MPEMKIFAVTGNPILHSKSPAMHNAAFRKLRVNAVYTRLLAQNADEALNTAKEIGIKGLNITAPFKEDFVKLADKIDSNAEEIGAVNTVIFKNSKAIGFNTDIDGISLALNLNGIKSKGKNIAILGAGGAAKAAVCALADKAEVTILNRKLDFEKAERLAEKFDCKAYSLEDKKMLSKIMPETDIIISCVSTAERIIPSKLLNKKTVVLDANYSTITALQKDAKQKGCKLIDGKEWLLFQGAEAFEIFIGKIAPIKEMRNAIFSTKGNARKMKNISLIGFMGTGKSAVAKEIAKKNKMKNVDIDENIEKNAGIPIKEIFGKFGGKKFRELEAKELERIIKGKNNMCSCGGGIVLDDKNVDLLKSNSLVAWLWANPETILGRVKGDARPLLNVVDKKKKINELLSERIEKYANACDFLVNSNEKKPEEIAKVILNEINKIKQC